MLKTKHFVTDNLKTPCFHCGDNCSKGSVSSDNHDFCCEGCRIVYEILDANDLTRYYSLNDEESIGIKPRQDNGFEFLDDAIIISSYLDFESEDRCKVSIELADIHCSSCIWLLENISKLDNGIIRSRVDFLKKKCSLVYDPSATSLRAIAILLNRIGYTPRFNQDQLEANTSSRVNRSLYYKIGIAGFSFGNIMLFSFPEYLGLQDIKNFSLFGYLNIILALPVFVYAASDYLHAAWQSIKVRRLGIDVPIAIGMLVLFSRSVFEILTHTGPGYLDSFTGFVFFLLIGKWFQLITFGSISFDRDYKSFFPMAVLKKSGLQWEFVQINKIKTGDIIRIKNEEIIPCDGILLSESAKIDYSFVTGEERIKQVSNGTALYAGGKQKGPAIKIEVTKPVDQSYLMQLWNEDVFVEERSSGTSKLINNIGHYFVIVILGIALMTMIYWYQVDPDIAFNATTAVLIIACPCVLALSIPFIYGNMIRILARRQIYCRNTEVLENISSIDTIIFDKTGTITDLNKLDVQYKGERLNAFERNLVSSLAAQSSHPLSRGIFAGLQPSALLDIDYYQEHTGLGLEGIVCGQNVKIGAPSFVLKSNDHNNETVALIDINGVFKGGFYFRQELRSNIGSTLQSLSKSHKLCMLSGDSNHDMFRMKNIFPSASEILFNQKPIDKLKFVKRLQESGKRIMMIGDGLNDSGAIRQSDIGIVLSQTNNNFTPACDVILSEGAFNQLARYLNFIKKGRNLLIGALGFSLLYNVVGLLFAVTGQLSPLVAAILMPLSSFTIMLYGISSTEILAWKLFNNSKLT